jgi:pimeloyl-ACP methyl ester carboxylesterase
VNERPVLFSQHGSLLGIVSEPAGGHSKAGQPACILLNAGLVHRVGPNRLYVRLARMLASAGYLTLRFDLSGRGDSDVRGDGVSFYESSVLEARAAMDFLKKTRGCERFVLMGICSGATNTFQTAVADPRVVGGVLIDAPAAYPTTGYYLRYYAHRLASGGSWRNTLTGRNTLGRKLLGKLAPPERSEEPELENPFGELQLPPKGEVAAALCTILRRGVKLVFIFSGSSATYKYANQFRDAFPELMKLGGIRVEYFPDADHTFTSLYNQERLAGTIGRWFSSMWPAGHEPASSGERARLASNQTEHADVVQ